MHLCVLECKEVQGSGAVNEGEALIDTHAHFVALQAQVW